MMAEDGDVKPTGGIRFTNPFDDKSKDMQATGFELATRPSMAVITSAIAGSVLNAIGVRVVISALTTAVVIASIAISFLQ
ncbi:MAG TPA: hypothetical protein VN457_02770, partial [Chlamydiales bacterium]|nr:hypothetical protein [Chlamydiales bacterium]